MNWGGFDFTAVGSQLGALGNQLGEAIQKAKHEVESTIEGFEKGDDFVPPVASSLPHDDAGKDAAFNFFTTVAQPAEEPPPCSPGAQAVPAEAVPFSQTAVPLPPQPAAVASSDEKPRLPKRKVIKKIIKKVPAHEASATGNAPSTGTHTSDAGSTPQHQQQQLEQPVAEAQQQQVQQHGSAEQQEQQEQQAQQELLAHPVEDLRLSANGWGADELDLQLGISSQSDPLQQVVTENASQQQQEDQQLQQLQEEHAQQLQTADGTQQADQPLPQEFAVQLDVQQVPQHADVDDSILHQNQQQQQQQHDADWVWQEQFDSRQTYQEQPALDTGQLGLEQGGLAADMVVDSAKQQQQQQQQQHEATHQLGVSPPAQGMPDANGNHVDEHSEGDQRVVGQQEQQRLKPDMQQHEQPDQPQRLSDHNPEDFSCGAVQQAGAGLLPNGHWQRGEHLQQRADHLQQQQEEQHLNAGADPKLSDIQQQLVVREGQLSRAAARLSELESSVAQLTEAKAELEVVVQQLTEANEHLALRAAKVSEAELQEVQQEATERLAAAERKVFALTKERDALKRAAAAASGGSGGGASDAAALRGQLHKKDELVSQLMEEGQKLSKRQLELEGNVKKLRQQLKTSEAEREKLAALLSAETAEAESLRRAKAKAERDLVAAVEAGRQEVEAVRQQAQADMLNTQAEQAAAQAVAAQAATGELAASLKAAESRNAALTESLNELQEALERQRAAADLREEMLRQDLADVERRAQAAETRHQELSAKLPEATAPLLRQISALQDASSAQAQAWAAAERSLASRLREAEANAAAAAAREAAAEEALGALQVRVAAAEASAAAAKSAANEAATRASRAEEWLALAQAQLEEQQAAAAESQALVTQLRDDMKAAEAAATRKLDAERSVRRAADEELARTRSELESLQTSTGTGVWGSGAGQHGGPPAMAAPGFKWVLVSEAEEAAAAAGGFGGAAGGSASLSRRMSSMSGQGMVGTAAHMSGLLDEDLAAAGLGGSSSQQGSEAAGLFDPGELFAAGQGGLSTPAYTPRATAADTASASVASQGYAGALGSPTASIASSRAAAAAQSAQARMVAARLGGGGTVAEAAVQRLRAALRQKAGECASMEGRLRELEATRDQLASELVKATHSAEQASDAVARLPQLQAEYQQLEQRYAAAVELLGERDEQLEEMAADLADVKQLYKQQIEALVAQLAAAGDAVQS